jgi:hypothetical protein
MSSPSVTLTSCAALLVLSSLVDGCAPREACPPVASVATSSSPAKVTDRHVYRFDFVLSSADGTSPPSSTSFTLNLQEADKGEVVVGKNVALSPPPPPSPSGGPGQGFGSARQDVGVKVAASFRMAPTGDDVILDVVTEMSTFEPPTTVRKMVMKGNAIASAGKPALVTTLDDDHKKLELRVTPTKLR